MRIVLYFLSTGLCLFLLNSCAGIAIGGAVSAFSIEAYEEARVHRTDLKLKPIDTHIKNVQSHINLPSLPGFKFFSKDPDKKDNKKTSAVNSPVFGFNCSRLESEKNESECYKDFSKALSQKEERKFKQKNISFDKKNKSITSQKNTVTTKLSLRENVNIPASNQSLSSSHIKSWANSWQEKDITSYLSFYSKEFKGLESNRADWEASRQRAFIGNKNISIKLNNIQVQQLGKRVIEVNFTQNYKSDRFSDTGIKKLLLLKKETGWKIVEELWSPTSPTIISINSSGRTTQVNKKLTSWIRAWENKDVLAYLSFYSEKFRTPKNSHIEWLDSRHQALQTKKNLTINIKNLKITENEGVIETNFIQEFHSDKYSDVGIKELVWIKAGDSWKIFKETWISS